MEKEAAYPTNVGVDFAGEVVVVMYSSSAFSSLLPGLRSKTTLLMIDSGVLESI